MTGASANEVAFPVPCAGLRAEDTQDKDWLLKALLGRVNKCGNVVHGFKAVGIENCKVLWEHEEELRGLLESPEELCGDSEAHGTIEER